MGIMDKSDLYKAKYWIKSTRLKEWDYSSLGYYFITICAKNHECVFGEILEGEMILSKIGEIVAEEWQKIEQIRPNIKLDEWIIMPNHLHGIIIIRDETKNDTSVETTRRVVSTLKPNSLGSIIGQFKSVSTKRIHAMGYNKFAWQPRFYDHIIRNEKSLEKIREYIHFNPLKWDIDENNPALRQT